METAMTTEKLIDRLWLVLMSVTLLSAAVAETAEPSMLTALLIAALIAFKGRMVVDHFMELRHAHPLLRISMRLYFLVIPALIIIAFAFPETIARWTALD